MILNGLFTDCLFIRATLLPPSVKPGLLHVKLPMSTGLMVLLLYPSERIPISFVEMKYQGLLRCMNKLNQNIRDDVWHTQY